MTSCSKVLAVDSVGQASSASEGGVLGNFDSLVFLENILR
jgi:hypothetical protein